MICRSTHREFCAIRAVVEPLEQRQFFSLYAITYLGPGKATGINDNTQGVGTRYTGTTSGAFSWSADAGQAFDSDQHGDSTVASAVDDSGIIVGYSRPADSDVNGSNAFRHLIGGGTTLSDADFPLGWVLTTVTLSSPVTARYVRYLSPDGSYGDISEFEVLS